MDNKTTGYFKIFLDIQAEFCSSTFKFKIPFSNTPHQIKCKNFQKKDKKRRL